MLFRSTAVVLDEIAGNSRYSDAVAAQQAKLNDPKLTPSAQILEAMQTSGLDYEAFILQQSRKHRNNIINVGISSEQQAYLDQLTVSSKEEQAQIEMSDTQNFDNYLADYLAQ